MTLNSASNIWQLQARGDVTAVMEALDSTDTQVRNRAIMALGAMHAEIALPKLKAMREREYNPQRLRLLEQAIAKLEPQPAPPPPAPANTAALFDDLMEQSRQSDASAAEKAILELGKLKDRRAVEHLVLIFRNHNLPAKVRLASAEALLMLESAPASVSLLGALRKPQAHVRRNSAAILGQLKADWAVEPLIAVMQADASPLVRKTAAAALRHIRTPEALQALQNMPPELEGEN